MNDISSKSSHQFCKALYDAKNRKIPSLLVHLELMLDDYENSFVVQKLLEDLTTRINELEYEESEGTFCI